jgi:hypothetical protein
MIPIYRNFDRARRRLGHEIHAKTIDYVGVFPAPSNGCRAAGPQKQKPKSPV